MNSIFAPTFSDSTTYQYGKKETALFRNARVALSFPPVTTYLVGDISSEFVIVQPLPINIEQDDDQSFVVSDDIFLIYGDGNNRLDAINDYVNSLIEFYSLVEDGAENNQFDVKLLSHLKSYIQSK